MSTLAHAAVPEPRNLRFATGAEVPRHWHGGRRAVTAFFDNLSLFFPAGERFFVTSVLAHKQFLDEEPLRGAVRAFCEQEGFHGREHVRYNGMLRDRGYPVEEMERKVTRLLERVKRVLPKRSQLAATCALEHFTALMAHTLLGDPKTLEGAHPTMAALWRWHAAEESEHKSVPYDVYLAANGGYFERIGIMVLATVVFWGKVIEQQVRFMHTDGIATSVDEWTALARFLFVQPGALRPLIRLYFAYYRPHFHPTQIDSAPLIAAWQRAQPV